VNALLSKLGCILAFTLYLIPPTWAASASDVLPVALMTSGKPTDAPVANSAFAPGPHVTRAPDFVGTITVAQTPMQSKPAIAHPMQDGRDARLFPAVTVEFFTMDGLLVPVQRGAMVRESASVKVPSFWQVIPQVGRVWKEAPDGKWSRAAFPLTLVNDIDNHSVEGLASFLYDGRKVTNLRFQFIQQNAPYLLHQHFVTWGSAATESAANAPTGLAAKRAAAEAELAQRLPTKPWSDLANSLPPGTLAGFGVGPRRRVVLPARPDAIRGLPLSA
jgi:hypothetical protein